MTQTNFPLAQSCTTSSTKVSSYGGNQVVQLGQSPRQVIFNQRPYFYAQFTLQAGDTLNLPSELGSFSVYVLEASADAVFEATGCNRTIKAGDALQVEACPFVFKLKTGHSASLLVAGVEDTPYPPGVRLQNAADIKLVQKPWGHELWISGEHAGYLFKQIFVRAPHKTSLQYHNQKEETIIVMQGCANLHYKLDPDVKNDEVTAANIATIRLEAGTMLGAKPGVLHRMEALSDLLLYETSTPHHHDVVRVLDDSNRPDGRIAGEHNS